MSIDWNTLLEYREGELYWKASHDGRCPVGTRAGKPRPSGYRAVNYRGTRYREHRVVWEMFNEAVPDGLFVDHINRKRDDNRIENLRVVTKQENNRNTFGKGWQLVKGRYSAGITIDGKRKRLGTYDTAEEAHQVYVKAKIKYHGIDLYE